MDLNTITAVAHPQTRAQLPVWTPGDAWLAGGTWLFSEPQVHLTRLIDLTDLEWPALTVTESHFSIAATCTVAQLDGFVSSANSCINNLRQLDGATQQWALEHHKGTNEVPHWRDIHPYVLLTRSGKFPPCPQGGKYTLGPAGGSPTCSIPDHKLP